MNFETYLVTYEAYLQNPDGKLEMTGVYLCSGRNGVVPGLYERKS